MASKPITGETSQRGLFLLEAATAGKLIVEYTGVFRGKDDFVNEWESSAVFTATKRQCPYVLLRSILVCSPG